MNIQMQTLSVLVHADSKVGKTTLAATSPLPIIALDVEGGWKFIGGSPFIERLYGRQLVVTYWDPLQGPPPRYDGTWEICVVSVTRWDQLQAVHNWLRQAQHDFKTIVVDSISELQRRCKQNIVAPTEQMKIQHWGVLLSLMDAEIRGLRDLTIDVYNPIQVAVFIAETRMQDGKWRPYMQGQITTALPYWMDIVGYLFVEQETDENGQPTRRVRKLLATTHHMYEAGERVQGRLPEVISEPNITHMFYSIYPPISNPQENQTS